MSAEDRTAIAAAASTVAGISCAAYHRQSTKTGDGVVRLAGIAKSGNGFGYVNTWQVWVVAPQDLAAAEKWLDTKTPLLIAALDGEFIGGVQRVTPAELVLGPGKPAVNGVIFEGAREG